MKFFKSNSKKISLLASVLLFSSCSGVNSSDPSSMGGSDMPNFMTESIVSIPSSLTGNVNLSKTLIDTKNHYLTRFNKVSDIMRLAETSKEAIENYLMKNKITIELIEKLNIDTTMELTTSSNKIGGYASIDISGINPKYSITFVNSTDETDTISNISYIKTNVGYKGCVFYKFDIGNDLNSRYKIDFDDTNVGYKTTKIIGDYDSAYTHLNRVVLDMKQENGIITLSGKMELPKLSEYKVNTFNKEKEIFIVNSAIDTLKNVASVLIAVAADSDVINKTIFTKADFINKVMKNEFLDYENQIFKGNPDQKKAAFISARDSILIDDIQKNWVDELPDSLEFTKENFMKYLSVNRENSTLGLKDLYDFSKIQQPIYLNSSAKFMFDKTEGLSKYKNLVADTISIVE